MNNISDAPKLRGSDLNAQPFSSSPGRTLRNLTREFFYSLYYSISVFPVVVGVDVDGKHFPVKKMRNESVFEF